MAKGDWNNASERMPTAADADKKGCIVVWHKLNGVMVTGWHRMEENRFMTHWQRCPEAPEGMEEGPGR